MATTTAALIAGNAEGPRVPLEFEVQASMAVPPWIQGQMSADAADKLETSVEGGFMGGPRYEQLFRATGRLRVGGESHEFTGDGPLIPARVVQAPWLGQIQDVGEDVAVVFESEALGRVRIEGETVVSTFDLTLRAEMPDFPGLYQGGVRYRWDGEETYGMLERSSPMDRLVFS